MKTFEVKTFYNFLLSLLHEVLITPRTEDLSTCLASTLLQSVGIVDHLPCTCTVCTVHWNYSYKKINEISQLLIKLLTGEPMLDWYSRYHSDYRSHVISACVLVSSTSRMVHECRDSLMIYIRWSRVCLATLRGTLTVTRNLQVDLGGPNRPPPRLWAKSVKAIFPTRCWNILEYFWAWVKRKNVQYTQ